MGPGTRCFPYQWVQLQTYESKTLFLMTSLQYYCTQKMQFEIDFVIEIKWYLTFWPLPRAPGGGAKTNFYVARPIHVSNSHTKFVWISSNGLGGDSITDRQQDWTWFWPLSTPKSYP